MPKRKTHEEFVLQVKNKFPNIDVVGLYIGNKTKIEFQCLVDGCFNKWMARPDNILSGYGCPKCAKKKISISRTKTHEEFILEFVPGVKCDPYDMIGIRFRNSGSTYTPFNNVFMGMFNQLQEYEPDYHQIHIEEVLYRQKVKKK